MEVSIKFEVPEGTSRTRIAMLVKQAADGIKNGDDIDRGTDGKYQNIWSHDEVVGCWRIAPAAQPKTA